jgi:SAM-dependent methyltransferase
MDPTEVIRFQCNICDCHAHGAFRDLTRETASCPHCRSSVRMRAIIHLLSQGLFGESLRLSQFPRRKDLRGVGLSDWDGYALRLTELMNYTNTFYHKEPRLDVTSPPPELHESFDFITCSDVLEHVEPPVERAFLGLYGLLKPGGLLVLTVPYTLGAVATLEHFPELRRYWVVRTGLGAFLLNITRELRPQVFRGLVFHGGVGSTLEMRVFTQTGLSSSLAQAGFEDIQIHANPYFDYGIVWSLPLTARRSESGKSTLLARSAPCGLGNDS